MNNTEMISFIRYFAKLAGIDLKLNCKNLHAPATYNPKKNEIKLGNTNYLAPEILLSLFFHEMGHAEAVHDKRFITYYTTYLNPKFNADYAYRAECDADKRGARMMKIWFPEMKFQNTYINNKKSGLAWLNSWFNLKS